MPRFKVLLLSLGLMLGLVLPLRAEERFNDQQKAEVGKIIRSYLLEHPELLEDMAKKLEERDKLAQAEKQQSGISENAKSIFRSNTDYVAGNPKGDVTMVEFFDYNCGWCKKAFPEAVDLLGKDNQIRLVLKEFPIFGEDSEYAARTVIAASKQNKYWDLHQALFMHQGKVTKAVVDEQAAALGLNKKKLEEDRNSPEVSAVLNENARIAQILMVNGTPAFIIGDKIIPGYLPETELEKLVKEVRQAGTCNKLC